MEVETGFVNSLLKFMYQIQSVQETNPQLMNEFSWKTTSDQSLVALEPKPRQEQCSSLIADLPDPPDLSQVTAKKMFFELVHLGAIKHRITVRFEKKAFELKLNDPSFGFGSIFYTLFTTVATISDSPLTFKEIIIMNTYTQ